MPNKRIVIHKVSKPLTIGLDTKSSCGLVASVDSVGVGATVLIDENGSKFYGTTHAEIVTCKKCINLATIGTIHEQPRPSRTTDAEKSHAVGRPRRHTTDRNERDRDKRSARRAAGLAHR